MNEPQKVDFAKFINDFVRQRLEDGDEEPIFDMCKVLLDYDEGGAPILFTGTKNGIWIFDGGEPLFLDPVNIESLKKFFALVEGDEA